MKQAAWKARIKEVFMQAVFFIAACTSILAVILICVFLFANGLPAIGKIGPMEFLLGTRWKPGNNIFGILPFILGSIYVTAGAILIGVPIGILTSIFMAYYCPKKIYRPLKAATELLAGIPSVVYGFFGMMVLVPLLRQIPHCKGNVMLTACILLGIMILPTIIGTTETALRSVPAMYQMERWHWEQPRSGAYLRLSSRRQNRCADRDCTGNRPGHRRDHGSYYGSRKSN